jgi:hypothetical protein
MLGRRRARNLKALEPLLPIIGGQLVTTRIVALPTLDRRSPGLVAPAERASSPPTCSSPAGRVAGCVLAGRRRRSARSIAFDIPATTSLTIE